MGQRHLRVLAVSVAVGATLLSVSALLRDFASDQGRLLSRDDDPSLRAIAPYAARQGNDDVRGLRRQVAALKESLAEADELPADTALVAELSHTKRKLSSLRTDVSNIRQALSPDPLKSLQVAFLRRDVDRLEVANAASISSLRDDIDRQYDLMKFIIGTLALGLIGVIVSIIVPAISAKR